MFSRSKNNGSERDDEDAKLHLVDKPVQVCYWEFNDKYELQRN